MPDDDIARANWAGVTAEEFGEHTIRSHGSFRPGLKPLPGMRRVSREDIAAELAQDGINDPETLQAAIDDELAFEIVQNRPAPDFAAEDEVAVRRLWMQRLKAKREKDRRNGRPQKV